MRKPPTVSSLGGVGEELLRQPLQQVPEAEEELSAIMVAFWGVLQLPKEVFGGALGYEIHIDVQFLRPKSRSK